MPRSSPAPELTTWDAPGRSFRAAGPPPNPGRRIIRFMFFTLLIPGSAQLTAGNRGLGRLLVRLWLLLVGLVVTAGVLYFYNRALLISLATNPVVLFFCAIVVIAWAFVWPLLVIDAWRLGRPARVPRGHRLGVSMVLVVCLALTTVPVAMAGTRLWAMADAVNSIFGGGRHSGAQGGRYNVLLLGADADADRTGVRPDTVILASVDADTGRTVLFSFPRNLENVPFPKDSAAARLLPNGWSCPKDCLLNAIYKWGTENKSAFPGVKDPGAEAMKQAVSASSGLKVNFYVMVDIKGFRDLINELGGIDINVNRRIPIGGGDNELTGRKNPVTGYIEPGRRHLDGYHALWYARSRHGSSDFDRIQRQRCVITAVTKQMTPQTVLSKFQGLASVSKHILTTDVPQSQLGELMDIAAKAKGQKMTSIAFTPPLIFAGNPKYDILRAKVTEAIEASKAASSQKAPANTPKLSGTKKKSTPTVQPSTGDTGGPVDLEQACSA